MHGYENGSCARQMDNLQDSKNYTKSLLFHDILQAWKKLDGKSVETYWTGTSGGLNGKRRAVEVALNFFFNQHLSRWFNFTQRTYLFNKCKHVLLS